MAGFAVGGKAESARGRDRRNCCNPGYGNRNRYWRSPQRSVGVASVAVGAFVGAMRAKAPVCWKIVFFQLAATGWWHSWQSSPKPARAWLGSAVGVKFEQVAPLAVDRRAGKFVSLLVYVTGAAVGNGVNSDKREAPRGVELEGVTAVLPVLRRMAILAGGAELAAMDIGVAIGAGGADMRKAQILVASPAIGARRGRRSAQSRFSHGRKRSAA